VEYIFNPPREFLAYITCANYDYIRASTQRAETTLFNTPSIIVIVVLLLISFVLTMALIYWLCFLKRRSNMLSTEEVDDFYKACEEQLNLSVASSSYSIRIAEADLVESTYKMQVRKTRYFKYFVGDCVLGVGQFGSVIRGALTLTDNSTMQVAIKSLNAAFRRDQLIAALDEVKVSLHVTGHNHVVSFLGICAPDLRKGKL
jgi:hypothetical protein